MSGGRREAIHLAKPYGCPFSRIQSFSYVTLPPDRTMRLFVFHCFLHSGPSFNYLQRLRCHRDMSFCSCVSYRML